MRAALPRPAVVCVAALLLGGAVAASDGGDRPSSPKAPSAGTSGPPAPDLTGRARTGKASFYARRFFGRPMADGTPMDPRGDNAASRTLPLGTKALVTHLETGRSAVVTIQDRGPYVKGRIVDLSPATARAIGLTPDEGVALVEVAPIAVPLPDGRVKPGVAARDARGDS